MRCVYDDSLVMSFFCHIIEKQHNFRKGRSLIKRCHAHPGSVDFDSSIAVTVHFMAAAEIRC